MSEAETTPARRRLLRRRRGRNPKGEMPLMGHLKELRSRLVVSVFALLVGGIVAFVWYQWAPGPLPSLGEILRQPYCALPPEKRIDIGGQCRLLATSPFEMLKLRLKVATLVGAVFASPVWLYEIWAFITPGLKKGERRFTILFVTIAVALFVLGAALALLVVGYGLEFLLTIGGESQVAALTGERYFNFLLALLLIFGVSFEIPLLLVMLNLVGVLEYEALKGKRRFIIVAAYCFAAVATPTGDPYSMLLLGTSIYVLVEIALQICRLNDRRRKKNSPDYSALSDDEASGPIDRPAPLGGAGGISRPAPISRPGGIGAPANSSRRWDGGQAGDYSDVL